MHMNHLYSCLPIFQCPPCISCTCTVIIYDTCTYYTYSCAFLCHLEWEFLVSTHDMCLVETALIRLTIESCTLQKIQQCKHSLCSNANVCLSRCFSTIQHPFSGVRTHDFSMTYSTQIRAQSFSLAGSMCFIPRASHCRRCQESTSHTWVIQRNMGREYFGNNCQGILPMVPTCCLSKYENHLPKPETSEVVGRDLHRSNFESIYTHNICVNMGIHTRPCLKDTLKNASAPYSYMRLGLQCG